MKKALVILLSAVMVMTTLIGCGDSGKDETKAPETQNEDNKETEKETEKEDTQEPVTISFWDENAGDQRTEFYMDIIEQFEKDNPNIKIDYLGLPSADALSKYQTAIVAGETPDTGGFNNSWAATVVGQGHCVAMDEWYDAWEGSKTMVAGNMEVARSYGGDGKIYMMPTSSNFILLWINDAMFEEAGLEAPATWDDFFAAAEKLTKKDDGQYGYTIRGGSGSAAVIIDFIYSYLGTNAVFDENGKTTINSDEAVAFLEKYVSMYSEFTPESDITAGYKEISANFDSGVAAMFTHNLGSYGNHVDAFGGTEGFTACPLPTSDNGTYVNYGGALTGIGMFDTCEDKDAAWTWISYMCDHWANSYWNQSIGQLPTNTVCFEDEWLAGMQHIQCATQTVAEDNCVTYLSPSYLPEWGSINSTYVEPAFQTLLAGDMTAKEFLDMWAEHLNEAYANYNK